MESPKITFVLFTYNEVARIERVIKNFQSFGKILLADNNSTDGTIELAEKNGCDIFLRKEEYVFVENQKLVDQLYEVITTEWIYWAFADEMLELSTLKEVERTIMSNTCDIISMDRKNYFYGEFCHDLFHARTYKLFKKHTIDFTNNVIHSMGKAMVPEERIYNLPDKYFVHHFISNNCFSYLNSINRYTEVDLSNNSYLSNSLFGLLLLVSKYYIKNFLYNKGYKAGLGGTALTEMMIIYSIIKNLKMSERKLKLTQITIEEDNNILRDMLMKNFS